MKKILIVLLSALVLVGCGSNVFDGLDDGSSTESIQFQIIKDLDEGRYQAVLDNPNANAIDYSAAAMGLAGLNTTSLIKAINLISDAGTNNNDLSPIGKLSLNINVLSIIDLFCTNNAPPGTDCDSLRSARLRLNPTNATSLSDADKSFQLVMLAIVDIVINFGDGVLDILGDPTDGISTQEANDLATNLAVIANFANRVNVDVVDIRNHVVNAGLGTGAVLDAITEIITALDFDGDGTVTATDIQSYLVNNFGTIP